MQLGIKLFLTSTGLLLALGLKAQTQYTLSFPGLQNDTIQMSGYAGRSLLVAVVDASAPDAAQLLMVDSLYKASDSSFSVLLLPVDDFGSAEEDSTLAVYLSDSLHLSFAVAKTGKASKSENENQHPLLKWLTHAEDNLHFDKDIDRRGLLYLMDESGNVYGLFQKETSPAFLAQALQKRDNN